MGTQLSETITTFFLGNSASLAQEVDKAKKLVAGLQKDYSKHVATVKGSILDPGSLVGKAGDKLAGSMKLSATSMGLAAAGGALLLKTFTAANRFAGEQADKMHAISEAMGNASRVNMFSSSLDGTATLVERLRATRTLMREATEAQKDANPYGFGGGVGGTMKTVIGNAQMSLKSAVGLGPYSNFERAQSEAATLELQKRIAAQDAAHMRNDLARGLRDQVGLTQERLSGSGFDSRVSELHRDRRRELQGIKGTDAYTPENRRNIRLRYNEQIAAERELQRFSENHFMRENQEIGIQRALVTEEQKRVSIIQKELEGTREQLLTGQHLTAEARQALLVQSGQQQADLNVAKADLTVAQAQHRLAEETVSIHARNTNAAVKLYQTELSTGRALREQIEALKDINTTRTQGLQISLAENDNAIREARQTAMFGKSGGQIQQQMHKDRVDRLKRDQFDQHMNRTGGGLIGAARNMAGDLIGGTDPITGEYRTVPTGTGLAEHGLHTGKLSDKPVGTMGGASMIADTDPGGGLHGGETPRFFMQTDVAKHMETVKGASDRLAAHTGDPAHDPAARLGQASIFRDFSKGDRDTLVGAHRALTAGEMKAGNTAASFLATSAPHFNAPHTMMQTAVQIQTKQLTTQETMVALSKQILSALDPLQVFRR